MEEISEEVHSEKRNNNTGFLKPVLVKNWSVMYLRFWSKLYDTTCAEQAV